MKRQHVKKTALEMVREEGLINLSRRDLCDRAGIPDGSFPHIMGCNFSEFLNELKAEVPKASTMLVSKSRVSPALRREQILLVAIEMAREGGYGKITRDAIAEQAGVSMGLVTRYFETMPQLRRDLMRAAVRGEVLEVIAQGLTDGNPYAKKASAEVKARAATLIANA